MLGRTCETHPVMVTSFPATLPPISGQVTSSTCVGRSLHSCRDWLKSTPLIGIENSSYLLPLGGDNPLIFTTLTSQTQKKPRL
ncbi:BBSome complex assembly protein BBS10 isoform 4-T6 [Spinachia spinachia]